jgi:putative membrane protein insertion efficiency factor
MNGDSLRRALSTAGLLPRNLLIAFILGWRRVLSPLYGQVCRYYPSCSAYGLGAVQQFGVFRGGAMTLWRILRCNPWSRGGIDDVPERIGQHFALTRLGFVLPLKKEV